MHWQQTFKPSLFGQTCSNLFTLFKHINLSVKRSLAAWCYIPQIWTMLIWTVSFQWSKCYAWLMSSIVLFSNLDLNLTTLNSKMYLFSLQDCITFMQFHHTTKRGTRNETLQVTEASKDKMMDNDCFVLLSFAFSLSTVMQWWTICAKMLLYVVSWEIYRHSQKQ